MAVTEAEVPAGEAVARTGLPEAPDGVAGKVRGRNDPALAASRAVKAEGAGVPAAANDETKQSQGGPSAEAAPGVMKGGNNMPGYDRTGPMGRGPMTGGGFGNCAGGRSRRVGGFGRGAGRGGRPWGGGRGWSFGGGRGRGAWTYGPAYGGYGGRPAGSGFSEAEELRAAAEDLKSELEAVEARLAELERNVEPG